MSQETILEKHNERKIKTTMENEKQRNILKRENERERTNEKEPTNEKEQTRMS